MYKLAVAYVYAGQMVLQTLHNYRQKEPPTHCKLTSVKFVTNSSVTINKTAEHSVFH